MLSTYVKCDYCIDGMFPSEYVVSIKTIDNTYASVFVDKSLVKEINLEKFLRVTLICSDDGISICVLPSEASNGSSWMRVPNNVLIKI